ncbi:MAG: HD domain-containing protein [Chloroflexi bacterium]|nr:HD domain-containing protein [Chloroflexota bacterium]
MNNPKVKTVSNSIEEISHKAEGKTELNAERKSIFWKLTSPYREWRNLPNEIRTRSEKSQRNLILLHEMLIDYRLALMKANHMDPNINRDIWKEFHQAKLTHETLNEITSKKSLFMRGLKSLKRLNFEWQNLNNKQNELLGIITQAPAALKFYNLKMTYAEVKKQELMDDEYNERRFSEAYSALEMALGYVEEFINKHENSSKILEFDEARQYWSEKFKEITELHKSGRMNIEDLLKKMDSLKNVFFEAPPMAKWITDVEERYTRLVNDHDLLINMYGKSVIPTEEINETKVIINEMVPRLWMNGENTPLDRYLKQIEAFLNIHEPVLQEELAYQERHRPWSANGDAPKDADELDMLTSFVQIMINAIEARESHMGDHSKTVAKLARGTAEELQWSEQEIKYLQIAGLMHDVGKIWIPETLLTKTGPLSENEIQILRMHPYYSAKIVESIKALKDIVPWVYNHHERWDGTGYPEGLRQNEIPLGASIIAVAEAFSAMIFNRLSREPLTFDQAIAEVRAGSGKQFDPDVTEQFITAATKIRPALEELQQKGFTSLLI